MGRCAAHQSRDFLTFPPDLAASRYHLLRQGRLGLPSDDGAADLPAASAEGGAEGGGEGGWVCPKVLFTTSTRDDRVHPGHARKMVKALLDEAAPRGKAPQVLYWENIEGGHGGAADNKQRAHMWALSFEFLAQALGLEGGGLGGGGSE